MVNEYRIMTNGLKYKVQKWIKPKKLWFWKMPGQWVTISIEFDDGAPYFNSSLAAQSFLEIQIKEDMANAHGWKEIQKTAIVKKEKKEINWKPEG